MHTHKSIHCFVMSASRHVQVDPLTDVTLTGMCWSCGEVLPVCSGPAIDSVADVLPPPLAQGRVPLGQRGRQGEGGIKGTVVRAYINAFYRGI